MKKLALVLILAASPAFTGQSFVLRAAKTPQATQAASAARPARPPQAKQQTAGALETAKIVNAPEVSRWEQEARDVTILRDDWGIAHVYGKIDADAVFGMIYAQAEDDFNRVETNYLNAMGRLAEAEGESKIYQDLRMKLFIDRETIKKDYPASPNRLKKLINAQADDLNYYLYKHPEAKPRVIHHFEPWMALSFTEGSIGGDIE